MHDWIVSIRRISDVTQSLFHFCYCYENTVASISTPRLLLLSLYLDNKHLHIDPFIFRLLAVLYTVWHGGNSLYLIAFDLRYWIVVSLSLLTQTTNQSITIPNHDKVTPFTFLSNTICVVNVFGAVHLEQLTVQYHFEISLAFESIQQYCTQVTNTITSGTNYDYMKYLGSNQGGVGWTGYIVSQTRHEIINDERFFYAIQ